MLAANRTAAPSDLGRPARYTRSPSPSRPRHTPGLQITSPSYTRSPSPRMAQRSPGPQPSRLSIRGCAYGPSRTARAESPDQPRRRTCLASRVEDPRDSGHGRAREARVEDPRDSLLRVTWVLLCPGVRAAPPDQHRRRGPARRLSHSRRQSTSRAPAPVCRAAAGGDSGETGSSPAKMAALPRLLRPLSGRVVTGPCQGCSPSIYVCSRAASREAASCPAVWLLACWGWAAPAPREASLVG